jgi:hypothetical protein
MSDPATSPTEPTEDEVIQLPQDVGAKAKKPRTDAQKTSLEQARLKAMAVRKENAELRKAEKEVEKMEKQQAINERKERVKKALAPQPSAPKEPEDDDTPEEVIYKKKKKARKQKIVYVSASESESEEEPEIIYKKKKKAKQATRFQEPVRAPEPEPPRQRQIYTPYGVYRT